MSKGLVFFECKKEEKLSFLARVKSRQEGSSAPSSIECSTKRHLRGQGCWRV
ncbi:hypothetical protein IC582_019701 [Cucumis melo]